jgi:hypothetical protein
MHVVQDIDGVIVARGQATPDGVTLQLCAPSGFTEPGKSFYPAESLTVNTLDGVKNLRALCDDLLAAHADHIVP